MKMILLFVGLGVSNAALHDQRGHSLDHTHMGKSISVV
jgi:hypothetical protein